MFKKYIFILLFLFIQSCKNDSYSDLIDDKVVLHLKFNAYNTATNNDARVGLEWALSQIGAQNINISFNGILQDENKFTINYLNLGFNVNAKEQLEKLHQKIKNSQAYKQNNNIDLGRYIALIIGVSEHYYKITNVPKEITNILENYNLETNKGYIDNSLVSNKHRILEYSKQNGLKQLFLTTEVEPITQEILEYETIEIMDNGQLRYGIFDVEGIRKNSATPNISNAGKPAKCMWCHESKISRLFSPQGNKDGFLSYLQLKDTLTTYYNQLNQKQLQLSNGVNFGETQEHTKMELLYISFMEPSAQVLSKEWNLSVAEVQNRLQSLDTHTYDEFPFLGNLYHRNEVVQFAPFTSLRVSSSIREQSQLEVNHID